MPARYSAAPNTSWVASILTSQIASVRSLLERIKSHDLPVEGGLELLTQQQ
jgi:hypothetical protein